jgi:hypothetical protein
VGRRRRPRLPERGGGTAEGATTTAARTRRPSSHPYSPKCLEAEFSEVRQYGVACKGPGSYGVPAFPFAKMPSGPGGNCEPIAPAPFRDHSCGPSFASRKFRDVGYLTELPRRGVLGSSHTDRDRLPGARAVLVGPTYQGHHRLSVPRPLGRARWGYVSLRPRRASCVYRHISSARPFQVGYPSGLGPRLTPLHAALSRAVPSKAPSRASILTPQLVPRRGPFALCPGPLR